jgi:hypothetical protein
MIGLIEGRDVHVIDSNGTHKAAKIVKVSDAAKRLISAFIYPVLPGEEGGVLENIPFNKCTATEPSTKPLTWHWIERVEA